MGSTVSVPESKAGADGQAAGERASSSRLTTAPGASSRKRKRSSQSDSESDSESDNKSVLGDTDDRLRKLRQEKRRLARQRHKIERAEKSMSVVTPLLNLLKQGEETIHVPRTQMVDLLWLANNSFDPKDLGYSDADEDSGSDPDGDSNASHAGGSNASDSDDDSGSDCDMKSSASESVTDTDSEEASDLDDENTMPEPTSLAEQEEINRLYYSNAELRRLFHLLDRQSAQIESSLKVGKEQSSLLKRLAKAKGLHIGDSQGNTSDEDDDDSNDRGNEDEHMTPVPRIRRTHSCGIIDLNESEDDASDDPDPQTGTIPQLSTETMRRRWERRNEKNESMQLRLDRLKTPLVPEYMVEATEAESLATKYSKSLAIKYALRRVPQLLPMVPASVGEPVNNTPIGELEDTDWELRSSQYLVRTMGPPQRIRMFFRVDFSVPDEPNGAPLCYWPNRVEVCGIGEVSAIIEFPGQAKVFVLPFTPPIEPNVHWHALRTFHRPIRVQFLDGGLIIVRVHTRELPAVNLPTGKSGDKHYMEFVGSKIPRPSSD